MHRLIAVKSKVVADTGTGRLQAELILELLRPAMLRRLRSEVGHQVHANTEIQLPVALTEQQAECYRKVLGRFYDILVDPKMHRLSSSRASQTKAICDELRKVCFPSGIVPALAGSSCGCCRGLAESADQVSMLLLEHAGGGPSVRGT